MKPDRSQYVIQLNMTENNPTGPLSSRSMCELRYLVVFNDVEPSLLEEEHDLGAGWRLRRTSISEMESLGVKHHFDDWCKFTLGEPRLLGSPANRYVHTLPHCSARSDDSYDITTPIPPKEWRFTLVYATDTMGIGPYSLAEALAISDLQLMIGAYSSGGDEPENLGVWPRFNGLGVRHRPGRTISTGTHNSAIRDPDWLIEKRQLGQIDNLQNAQDVIEWRRSAAPDHVLDPIHMFLNLDRLPDYNQLKHLGYFGVLESILSHPPNDGDRVDSIRRQLTRNLGLVNQRLGEVGLELPVDSFGDASLDTIVSKLYSYRSAIAHGGNNIESKVDAIDKLRVGSTDTTPLWVHDYLRTLVRRVLQALIREPELFRYIK